MTPPPELDNLPTADNLKVRQESPRKLAPPGLVKIAVVDPEPTAFTGEWKSTQPEVSDVLPPVKQESTLAEVKQEAVAKKMEETSQKKNTLSSLRPQPHQPRLNQVIN